MPIQTRSQTSRGLLVVWHCVGQVVADDRPVDGGARVDRSAKAEGINPDGLYYTDVFTDNSPQPTVEAIKRSGYALRMLLNRYVEV